MFQIVKSVFNGSTVLIFNITEGVENAEVAHKVKIFIYFLL